MTHIDLRVLCTALGFTAVVIEGKNLPLKDRATKALAFAGLIEEFCRTMLPDAFSDNENAIPNPSKFTVADTMATAIAQIKARKGGCQSQDLIEEGFSLDEIERYWTMAKALAYVEFKLMNA